MKIESFVWDDKNIEHISHHGVNPDEAEEIFISKYFLLKTRQDRYMAFGKTFAGRYLIVVFEFLESARGIQVITARDMDEKEKKLYRRKLKL
ncbi:hypothetical protein AUJ66_02550 [Candidatus Desantisbacteria bacterium CG1_02_38_46]|uniref:BrnT family toxin n=1 Tax=Candidatus Desantisbacteria bacterium CG1_02_38_46 TaxID=1817893 RepID=A0A1J4SE71_9BACT|nr:MAG: hypothetical protein AUJ66_02550 [Candidatus Desantisbacteria bacterium CG1_02_38_46]